MSNNNQIIVDIANLSRFDAGRAVVIGTRPVNEPYVNIEDKDGKLVASITRTNMEKLVEKWNRAMGRERPLT